MSKPTWSYLTALLTAWLGVLGTGCASLSWKKPEFIKTDKPGVPIHQIAATWEPKVLFAPDPTRNGQPMPGLAGRLYLFGQDSGYPVEGDGKVVVDLYDDSAVASGGKTKLIEKWCIDQATLQKLVRKDMIGSGYTLFLPWGTYRPDINQVHMMVAYTPKQGTPHYSPGATITLNNDLQMQTKSRTIMPAGHQQPALGQAGPPQQPLAYQPPVVQTPATVQPAANQPRGTNYPPLMSGTVAQPQAQLTAPISTPSPYLAQPQRGNSQVNSGLQQPVQQLVVNVQPAPWNSQVNQATPQQFPISQQGTNSSTVVNSLSSPNFVVRDVNVRRDGN